MSWLGALWHLVSALTGAGDGASVLLIGTAAAASALIAAVLAVRVLPPGVVAGAGARVRHDALRRRAARTGVPRHRDPDASGRSRPRAPTAVHAAA